jgi:hypothetical protein
MIDEWLKKYSNPEIDKQVEQEAIDLLVNEVKRLEKENEELRLTAVVQAKPEKVFDIHSCINEICYAANKDSCLFNDNINNHSFRFRIKKAIDKLMYTK